MVNRVATLMDSVWVSVKKVMKILLPFSLTYVCETPHFFIFWNDPHKNQNQKYL